MENEKPVITPESTEDEQTPTTWKPLTKKEKALLHRRSKRKKPMNQSLVDSMERARLAEYAMYCERPLRLIGMNFLIGLARGLGATIGLGIVLSLLVFVAQELISANLPIISQWMADIINMVQSYSVQSIK